MVSSCSSWMKCEFHFQSFGIQVPKNSSFNYCGRRRYNSAVAVTPKLESKIQVSCRKSKNWDWGIKSKSKDEEEEGPMVIKSKLLLLLHNHRMRMRMRISIGVVVMVMVMVMGHDNKAWGLGPEGPMVEEFWENVRRYGLYALTVSTGVLYAVLQPIVELLKNPISAILVIIIFGATFFIFSQVLSAMFGVSDFAYQYAY